MDNLIATTHWWACLTCEYYNGNEECILEPDDDDFTFYPKGGFVCDLYVKVKGE